MGVWYVVVVASHSISKNFPLKSTAQTSPWCSQRRRVFLSSNRSMDGMGCKKSIFRSIAIPISPYGMFLLPICKRAFSKGVTYKRDWLNQSRFLSFLDSPYVFSGFGVDFDYIPGLYEQRHIDRCSGFQRNSFCSSLGTVALHSGRSLAYFDVHFDGR